jgi:membrane fusion protein (multidrug efflux system)
MTVMKPRTQDDAAPALSSPVVRPRFDRRRLVRGLLFLLLPLALIAGAYLYVGGGRIMSTENAYVRADMVGVSTDVSGIVKDIAVHENQAVALGDVLFRLDDQPFRLALARAEAQIGNVTNDINALKASYRDMQAQIRQAQVDVAYYTRDQERQRQLAQRQAASEVTYEQAQRNLQTSQQKVESLTQQLAGIVANLAGDPEIAIERHPRYQEAVAQRDEAARQLAHTVVRAPKPGVVTNVPSLQPGQYLAAATPAFAVVATDHLWVDANPKETELTHVLPGQPVTVTVDTYPGVEWHGVVDSVSPASSGSFSLLPAQNTSGNWVKVVQRIPMRVRIETPEGLPQLRAGMSVVISVDTGHPRGLPLFLQGLFGRSNG